MSYTLPVPGDTTGTWGTVLNSYLNGSVGKIIDAVGYGLDPTGTTDNGLIFGTLLTNAAAASVASGAPTVIYFDAGTYLFGTTGTGPFNASPSPQQSTGKIIIMGAGKDVTWIRPSRHGCKCWAIQMPCEIWDMTLSGQYPLGTMTGSTLATTAPITSLAVTALLNPIGAGKTFMINTPGGVQSQVFTCSTGAVVGATSIPINSATPNFAFPSGSLIAMWSVINVACTTNIPGFTSIPGCQSFAGSTTFAMPVGSSAPTVGSFFTMGGAGWQGGQGGFNGFPVASTISSVPTTGQILYTAGNPTSGTFTLTWGGNTTGNLNWNATAAQVQTALRLLAGGGAITCTGLPTASGSIAAAQLPTPNSAGSSGGTIQNSGSNGGILIGGVNTGTVTVTPVATTVASGSNNNTTTIAAGSNGVTLTSIVAGTLAVAATTGFATSGNITLPTSGGTAVLSYTTVTGGGSPTFNGIGIVSGTGSWTLATGGVVNSSEISTIATWTSPSAGVLDIASITGLASAGTVTVATSTTTATITYTGTAAGQLTGCAYVSGSAAGAVSTGGAVTQTTGAVAGTGSPAVLVANTFVAAANAGANTNNNIQWGPGSTLPNGVTSSLPISRFAFRRVCARDQTPGGGGYVIDVNDSCQPPGGYNTNTGQALYLSAGATGTFTLTDTVQGKTTAGISASASASTIAAAFTTATITGITCFGGPLPGAPANGVLPTPVYFQGVQALELTVGTGSLTGTATIYNPMRGELGLMSDAVNSHFGIQEVVFDEITAGPSNNNHNNLIECGGVQKAFLNKLEITGLGAPAGLTGPSGSRAAINFYGVDRVVLDGMHYDYTGAANATYLVTFDWTFGSAGEAVISNVVGSDTSTVAQQPWAVHAPYVSLSNVHMPPIGNLNGAQIELTAGGGATAYDSGYPFIDIVNCKLGNGIDIPSPPVGHLNISNSEIGPLAIGSSGGCIRIAGNSATASGPIHTSNVEWNMGGGIVAQNCNMFIGTNANQMWQVHVKGGGITRTVGGMPLWTVGQFVSQGNINSWGKLEDVDGFNGQTVTTINGNAIPASPVSTTVYGPYLCDVWLTANCATTSAAGTVTLATAPGPVGTSFTNVATFTPAVSLATGVIPFRLPANTSYKFTFSNATVALTATN